MQLSHLWADLAVEHSLLHVDAARHLLGRFWQAVGDGYGRAFPDWLREQPEVDADAFARLEQLAASVAVECLSCHSKGVGRELQVNGNGELCCPRCQRTSVKRGHPRDRQAATRPLQPAQPASPATPATPQATPATPRPTPSNNTPQKLPVSLIEGWGESESTAPPDEEVTKTERHVPAYSAKATTRRMAPPSSVNLPGRPDARAHGSALAGDTTQFIHGLQRVGNWFLESAVGQGGIGVVFRARHHTLRRQAAVKVLKNRSASMRQRFEREAQICAELDHPNIIRVYDYGDAQGQPYIVMEWIDAENLSTMVERHGSLDVPRVVDVAQQACSALACAHQVGVIHRDIKPDNLMLTTDGRLKITDFGIAHVEDSRLTMQGTFIGTPLYMAPEQFRQESITCAADVYALGATLYFLLAGEPPFKPKNVHSNAYQLLVSKATVEFPSIRQHRPNAPEALDHLLAHMCAVQPRDRPSIHDVEAALASLAQEAGASG